MKTLNNCVPNNAERAMAAIPARIMPVLSKGTYDGPEGGSVNSLIGKLERETVPVDDSFDAYSDPWDFEDGQMEIHVTESHGEETDRRGPEGERIWIMHYSVSLRYVPRGTNGFKYSDKAATLRPRMSNHKYKYIVDGIGVGVQRDIVKHCDTLLLPFLYAVYGNADPKDGAIGRMLRSLDALGVVIDSIELDEDTVDHPEFLEWFHSVGQSLLAAYEKDVDICMDELLSDDVYVVYGKFDPATRENLLDDAKEEEE